MRHSRLLYVMGRGHSGSTVLDALLGNGPRMVAVGELVPGMLRFADYCSCGDTIEACEFWQDVRQRLESESGLTWSEVAELVQSQAHISRFFSTLISGQKDAAMAKICLANRAIVETITRVGDADVLVDSSKEFTRALMLARREPTSRIIHVVRSPHQVLASLALRLRTGKGYSFLRRRYRARALTPIFMSMAATGWLIGNLLGELIHRMAPTRVLRVRYEDLCVDSEGTLHAIGQFTGVDFGRVAEAVAAGDRLSLAHKLAGNRMRREGTFVFEPSRVEGRKLSLLYVILTSVITWPLLLAYGYGLTGRPRYP